MLGGGVPLSPPASSDLTLHRSLCCSHDGPGTSSFPSPDSQPAVPSAWHLSPSALPCLTPGWQLQCHLFKKASLDTLQPKSMLPDSSASYLPVHLLQRIHPPSGIISLAYLLIVVAYYCLLHYLLYFYQPSPSLYYRLRGQGSCFLIYAGSQTSFKPCSLS